MSDDTFSEDLFAPGKTIENTPCTTNPYSFHSFIDHMKVEKSLTEQLSFCIDQNVKSTKKQSIDVTPDQEVDFSNENQYASNDDFPLDIISTTFDNPFSFKRFQKSQLDFSDKTSDLLTPNSGIINNNGNFLTCPTYTENDYIVLQEENSDLRKSKFQLQKEVEVLHNKNASLSGKLYKLQQKDSNEAKALEQVIINVEASLDKANMRALSAENELEKVMKDYAKLKTLCNVKLQEYFEQQAESACAKLRLATTEAEYLLNQLLAGVGNLRQTADFIGSMHKIYESEI